jgi:hypothetical protein
VYFTGKVYFSRRVRMGQGTSPCSGLVHTAVDAVTPVADVALPCWSRQLGCHTNIQIAEGEVQALQYNVHEVLKRLPSIQQPEWHPQKLPKSKRHDDCRLVDITHLYRYLVIFLTQI